MAKADDPGANILWSRGVAEKQAWPHHGEMEAMQSSDATDTAVASQRNKDASSTTSNLEWWEEWRKSDYSWHGLGSKRFNGLSARGDNATLQDYWSYDVEESSHRSLDKLLQFGLVEKHGLEYWHIAHLPPILNGIPTWKSDLNSENWARLERQFLIRLNQSQQTPGSVDFEHKGHWQASGMDRRAIFDGSIARRAHSELYGRSTDGLNISLHKSATLAFADYQNARFSSAFIATDSLWAHGARFRNSTFSDYSDFSNSQFAFRADFNHAKGNGDLSFNDCYFDEVTLYEASVSGSLWFIQAAVSSAIKLDRCMVQQSLRMDRMQFNDRATLSMRRTRVEGPCDLTDARLPNSLDSVRRAFEGATFGGVLSLDGVAPVVIAAAGDAQFTHGVTISEDILLPETRKWKALHAALYASAPSSGGSSVAVSQSTARSLVDSRMRDLEGGARTLRAAMEGSRNESRQLQFLRLQLRLKRRRASTGLSEKLGLIVYASLSDYGRSVGRPWLAFACLAVLFGAFYMIAGYYITDSLIPPAHELIRYSLKRSLPILPWADDQLGDWTGKMKLYRGSGEIVLTIVSGLQTAMSSLCIFLFGLAVRRRLVLP